MDHSDSDSEEETTQAPPSKAPHCGVKGGGSKSYVAFLFVSSFCMGDAVFLVYSKKQNKQKAQKTAFCLL